MSTPRPLGRRDLVSVARCFGVPPEVVEKDYLLSYLLAGLAAVPDLGGLRFKGGTALKKMYFGDYRFSEDLDFTVVDAPSAALDPLIALARQTALDRLSSRGRFQVVIDRLPERDPHPAGQNAFRVLAALPWQRTPLVRIKIEVTSDEPVLLPTPRRALQHGYEDIDEQFEAVQLATYALEEIVAEKLRAILQTQQRLFQRGWSRPRARDYYDLWRILTERAMELRPALVRQILPAKLAVRGVTYKSVEDFFTPALLSETRRHWQSNLAAFVPALPDVDTVLTALPSQIAALFDPAP